MFPTGKRCFSIRKRIDFFVAIAPPTAIFIFGSFSNRKRIDFFVAIHLKLSPPAVNWFQYPQTDRFFCSRDMAIIALLRQTFQYPQTDRFFCSRPPRRRLKGHFNPKPTNTWLITHPIGPYCTHKCTHKPKSDSQKDPDFANHIPQKNRPNLRNTPRAPIYCTMRQF